MFSDTYLLWKIGIIWCMDWNWDPWDNLLCQTLRGCQPETTLLSAWRFCDFRSQTLRAGLWLWIWGCWSLIPLHPTPKLRQARFLAATSVMVLLDPSEPWALCPVPLHGCFMVPRVQRNSQGKIRFWCWLTSPVSYFYFIFGVLQMNIFMSTRWYIWRYFILFNITLLLRFYSAFGFVNWELLRVSRLP